jgi:hypothetical protein
MSSEEATMHPEHDRTSCSDEHPINADAEGSTGCARCTALVMERGEERVRNLELLIKRLHKAKGRYHTQLATCDLFDAVGLPNERPKNGGAA